MTVLEVPDVAVALANSLHLPVGTKGIVFDCDGTLLDTMALHWQSWKEACVRFGLSITLEWWQAQAGKPAEEILTLLCHKEVRPLHPPLLLHSQLNTRHLDSAARLLYSCNGDLCLWDWRCATNYISVRALLRPHVEPSKASRDGTGVCRCGALDS